MDGVQAVRSRRRQNASCDPCRRSKRRCLVPYIRDGETDSVCANCKRLGIRCTFNFADSRSGPRLGPNKTQRRNPTSYDQSLTGDGLGLLDSVAEEFTDVLIGDLQAGFSENDDVLEPWLDFDIDRIFNDRLPCIPGSIDPPNTSTVFHQQIVVPAQTQYDFQGALRLNRSNTVRKFLPHEIRSIVGSSLSSPIHLLNSSSNATILDNRLTRIYDTISTGSASIFLDYDCNLYTSKRRYWLEDRGSQRSQVASSVEFSDFSNGTIANSSISMSLPTNLSTPPGRSPSRLKGGESETASQALSTQENGRKMTVLGAVRFLDHFSDLYGNRQDSAAQRLSDEVLKQVLRVFSSQWLPTSNSQLEGRSALSDNRTAETLNGRKTAPASSPNPFLDTWFKARSLVDDAKSVRSFRVVYATLLFDTIAIPKEASDNLTESKLKHEFLDIGLRKLSFLDGLVKKYCANLGPCSEYAALMESSLNIICWFGYLRDTVAALTMSRPCKHPDLRSPAKGGPSIDVSVTAFTACQRFGPHSDGNILKICRKGIAEAFLIWRRIIKIKNAKIESLDGVMEPLSRTSEAVTSTLTAVDGFEQLFRPFMLHCVENFANLSTSSKTFSAFFIVFWDLGVLVLAESLKSALSKLDHSFEHSLISKMRTYQWQAALSVAQTAECVLALPTEETFDPQSGLNAEVPITACHVTPGLMVAALQKAVEQIIDLQSSSDYGLIPDSLWDRHIGFLMKGLMSLEVTIGGSRTASVAFQSLMRKYGDILSECWPGSL